MQQLTLLMLVFKKMARQLPEAETKRVLEISDRISKAKLVVYEATVHLDRNTWQETRAAAVRSQQVAETTRKTAHEIKSNVRDLRNQNEQNHESISSQITSFRCEMLQEAGVIGDELARATRQLKEDRKFFEEGLKRQVLALPESIHEAIQGALYQMVADDIFQKSEYTTNPVHQMHAIAYNPSQGLMTLATLPYAHNNASQGFLMEPLINFTIDDVLEALQAIDPTTDAHNILRKEALIGSDAIEHANTLRIKPQFKAWLTADSPSLLIVDGCCRDLSVGRTSPMSVFTASLASTLLMAQTGIVTQFYCAQHADPRSNDSGPKSLLRSLINQLILYPKPGEPSLDFVDKSLLDAVAGQNTNAICFLFEKLFWQIDANTSIYVLVDGLSDFESSLHGFAEKMDRVFDLFRKLIDAVKHSPGAGPKLKVLMTSPNRSHRIARLVNHADEYIRLDTGGRNLGRLDNDFTRSMRHPRP